MAHLDGRQVERRRDDELRAGQDHLARRLRIEHGPGAELEAGRQLTREPLDQPDRARHGHRDFERADAAVDKRLDDGPQLVGLLHPDHGDDAAGFDFLEDA